MTALIDKILEKIPYDTVTDTEVSALLKGTKASRYNQLKRSLAKGELLHIRRGLYLLAKRYQRKPLNQYALAQKIYTPSYISFESALSYHGLIPEAVYTVSSASLKRSREFKTPVGVFAFTQIPQRVFYAGVDRIEKDWVVFLMARPSKALADYVFYHRSKWKKVGQFLKSLRIEPDSLKIDPDELQSILQEYNSQYVTLLFKDLKKEFRL